MVPVSARCAGAHSIAGWRSAPRPTAKHGISIEILNPIKPTLLQWTIASQALALEWYRAQPACLSAKGDLGMFISLAQTQTAVSASLTSPESWRRVSAVHGPFGATRQARGQTAAIPPSWSGPKTCSRPGLRCCGGNGAGAGPPSPALGRGSSAVEPGPPRYRAVGGH